MTVITCCHCSDRIHQAEWANIWLHSNGEWMCYPRTHAQPDLGEENDNNVVKVTDFDRLDFDGDMEWPPDMMNKMWAEALRRQKSLEWEENSTKNVEEGRKGLVSKYPEDHFYNQYIDDYDANPVEGENG